MPKHSGKSPNKKISQACLSNEPARFDKIENHDLQRSLYGHLREQALGIESKDPQEWLWIISDKVTDDQLRSACLREYIREMPELSKSVSALAKVIKECEANDDQIKFTADESSFWGWFFLKLKNSDEERKKKIAQFALKLVRIVYPIPLHKLLSLPVERCAFGLDGTLQSKLILPKINPATELREPKACWVGRVVKYPDSDWMMEIKPLNPCDGDYCYPPKSICGGLFGYAETISKNNGKLLALVIPSKMLRLKRLYSEIADWLGFNKGIKGALLLDVNFLRGSPLVTIQEGGENLKSIRIEEDLAFFAATTPALLFDGLMTTIRNKQDWSQSQITNWDRVELMRALRVLSSWRIYKSMGHKQCEDFLWMVREAKIEGLVIDTPSIRLQTVENDVNKEFRIMLEKIFPNYDADVIVPKEIRSVAGKAKVEGTKVRKTKK